MIRIILMLSIGCLIATLVSFFFQSEFSSDTFNDNSPVISLKELSPKRYSSASTQTTDNSKRNVDIHMKSVERPHINAVFSQIENGNFDNIALFHSLNMECQSTLGFESKEEYMGEYSQQSNMDTYSAESLYDSCSGVNTKKFEEQIEIYREAVEVGESRAEFFLGLTYPPNFKNRIYWLSKSATWKNESIEIISESIHSSSAPSSYKLFWSYVIEASQVLHLPENPTKINELELEIGEQGRIKILDLSELWLSSNLEEDKRKIIKKLENII